ncbi:MAG: LytTR family transcriptional regulator [Bacteroidales bacterium]|nr:LytTR family transcriptional regulator [Bacteroidales bacterium]
MSQVLRLGKGFSTQVIYMIVLPFFFFTFAMLYDPFQIQEYYSFGSFNAAFHIVMLSCILLVWLILCRTVFYFLDRELTLHWWQYALWCFGEVLSASAFMALYTSLFRHEGSNYFGVLANCFVYTAMTLVFPYVFLIMQQIIYNRNEDLRNKDLLPEKNLVRFLDEHKRLKLSIAPSSVLYVKSEFNYLKIYYLSAGHVKEYTLRNSMKSLGESVPPQVLVRCQRSYFINPAHVKVLWKDKEGLIYADLDVADLPSIPVSKQYYDTIAALL